MRQRLASRLKDRSRRLSLEILEERSAPTDVRSLGGAWTQLTPQIESMALQAARPALSGVARPESSTGVFLSQAANGPLQTVGVEMKHIDIALEISSATLRPRELVALVGVSTPTAVRACLESPRF
jgi:hypothetical protein